MTNQNTPTSTVKKGFFAKLLEKLDKKMEEKSKKSSCCSSGDNTKEGSCC